MNLGSFGDDQQRAPCSFPVPYVSYLFMCLCFSCFQSWVQGVLWIQGLESLLRRALADLPHTLHRPAGVSEWHRDLHHLGQWDRGHRLGQDTFLEIPEAGSYPQRCQKHRGCALTNFCGQCAFEGRAMKDPHWFIAVWFFQSAIHLCAPFFFLLVITVHLTKVISCDWSKRIYFWKWRGIGKSNPNSLAWLQDRFYGNC